MSGVCDDHVVCCQSDQEDRFSQSCCYERAMFSIFLCILVIVIHKMRGSCLQAFVFSSYCINPNIVVKISHNIVVSVFVCLMQFHSRCLSLNNSIDLIYFHLFCF